jgi:Zn-dependent metalloprotease
MSVGSFFRLGVTAALAATPATTALALVAPQSQLISQSTARLLSKGEVTLRPVTNKVALATFGNRFDAKTSIEVDSHSGAIRLITGNLAPAPRSIERLGVSDLLDVATNWIAAHEDLLQVHLEDLSIVSDATLMTPDVQFIRFKVARHGTPIADASINFRFKFGKLVQIESRTFGEARDDARGGFISATDAIERIVSAASIQEQGQLLRVKKTTQGYRLVRVNKSVVMIDGQTLNIQTDVATGDIFEAKDTRRYADGHAHGLAFPRTYYQSQAVDVPMIEMNVTTGTAVSRTDLTGKFSFDGAVAPKITSLGGQKITIRSSTGTAVARTATETGGTWDLNLNVSAEKDQAQVHTFHHLNLIIQKAKKYIAAPWLDSNLRANVNLGQTCNAYWDGTSVNFFSAGGGCGNTGLISDVMYHEWGHGLDENTGGIDDGAYSEGFGDILSMIMTNDSKLGPGFRSTGGIVRDMEPDKVYPKDCGEVHAEGLIIGGTFWDLFKSLTAKYDTATANDIVSGIAFKTIFTATNYTDVYNAALVVNDNDTDTATRSPDFCEINGAFALHGLATKATDCP